MLRARLRRLEAALVPSAPRIDAWFTLEGEPVEPPAEVVDRVEAEARALGLEGPCCCAVWLPDHRLAFLVGEGELQFVELGDSGSLEQRRPSGKMVASGLPNPTSARRHE